MLLAILSFPTTSLFRPSWPLHFTIYRRCLGWNLRARDGKGEEASEEEEPAFKIDADKAREALRQLDQELQSLSQNQTPVPSRRRPTPSQESYKKNDPLMDPKMAKSDEVMFPEITDSFLAYTAAFLLFITFAYNLVFLLYIKPSIDNATDMVPPTLNKQVNSSQKQSVSQLQPPPTD